MTTVPRIGKGTFAGAGPVEVTCSPATASLRALRILQLLSRPRKAWRLRLKASDSIGDVGEMTAENGLMQVVKLLC
jgi:hypothetical protein